MLGGVKSVEKNVVEQLNRVSVVFLLGAVAAAIAWMVYVAKYSLDFYNQLDEKTIVAHIENGDLTPKDAQTVNQYTICFQAVVASALVYLTLRHMHMHTQ